MASVFFGSGQIPFFDTICPKTLTSAKANLHLSKFNFIFACVLLNTFQKHKMLFHRWPKNGRIFYITTAHLGCKFLSIQSNKRWKMAPDISMPTGNTFL